MKINETGSGGSPQADGITELVERCRAMETDLAEMKDRLAAVQRLLQQELRKSSGTDYSAERHKGPSA
jgi:hypothetical protein